MSTIDKANITTAEQLLQLPKDFGPCELVRGELTMLSPGGFYSGSIQMNLISCLVPFVKRNRLGKITPSEAGFILETDERTVRVPDVAFVCADRLPAEPITGILPRASRPCRRNPLPQRSPRRNRGQDRDVPGGGSPRRVGCRSGSKNGDRSSARAGPGSVPRERHNYRRGTPAGI